MGEIDPRDDIQSRAKKAWLDSDRKNTLVVPTGGGKSKITIDILKELYERDLHNVLLLTNSTELRDNSWKQEFSKWGYKWESIQSECYQTVYKWKDKHYDLVIADR